MLTTSQRSYLAGLIDGEGCIFVNGTKTTKGAKGCKRGIAYRSGLAITMTGRPVLEWARRITRVGKIQKCKLNKKHKQAWRWAVWSNQASNLLKQVFPFLILKQKQAQNQIHFQSRMRYPGRFGLTNAEWTFRKRCCFVSTKLNKRGR
jgi:hypothetical protein